MTLTRSLLPKHLQGPAPLGPCFIFGLVDPRTESIFYAGQTGRGHTEPEGYIVFGHTRKKNSKVYCKLKSLHSKGLEASWIVLEDVRSELDLDDAEKFWIASFRAAGAMLTNFADGGRSGNRGVKHSAQARKNVSDGTRKAMQRSEVKEKMRTPEYKAAVWPVGRKRTEQTKARQRERAFIAQNKPAQISLLSAAAKSQWSDPVGRAKKIDGKRKTVSLKRIRRLIHSFDRKLWMKMVFNEV